MTLVTAAPAHDPALLFELGTQGPGTHVLVIGVGSYEHVRPETAGGPAQLTSSTFSARAVTDWFLSNFENEGRPLASLALVLSEPEPADYTHPCFNGRVVQVPRGTLQDASAAIKHWIRRSGAEPDNLLVLYLAGHGVSAGTNQLFLLRDFGQDPDSPSGGCLNIGLFASALKVRNQGRQLLLVDACREPDEDLEDVMLGGHQVGDPIIGVTPARLRRGPPASQCGIFSTVDLGRAHGRPNGLTIYAEALIAGLNGGGAEASRGYWVGSHGLDAAISAVVGRLAEERGVCQSCASMNSQAFEVHRPHEILVPFHVTFPAARQASESGWIRASVDDVERFVHRWHSEGNPPGRWSFVGAHREHVFEAVFDAPKCCSDLTLRVVPGLPETLVRLPFERTVP